jgi:hypothetical protein
MRRPHGFHRSICVICVICGFIVRRSSPSHPYPTTPSMGGNLSAKDAEWVCQSPRALRLRGECLQPDGGWAFRKEAGLLRAPMARSQ